MSKTLEDFQKKKDYLICVDSDGCAASASVDLRHDIYRGAVCGMCGVHRCAQADSGHRLAA